MTTLSVCEYTYIYIGTCIYIYTHRETDRQHVCLSVDTLAKPASIRMFIYLLLYLWLPIPAIWVLGSLHRVFLRQLPNLKP